MIGQSGKIASRADKWANKGISFWGMTHMVFHIKFLDVGNYFGRTDSKIKKIFILLETIIFVISTTAFVVGYKVEDTLAQVPQPTIAPVSPQDEPNLELETVYFDYNKADIRASSEKVLDRNGEFLKDNPSMLVLLVGHADSYEQGSLELSERRALNAKEYIRHKFSISDQQIMIEGCGSAKPIGDNEREEGRSRNRRVEFSLITLIPAEPTNATETVKWNTTYFWNAWAEQGKMVKFKPASHMKPKSEYTISLHLSNVKYTKEGKEYWAPTKRFAAFLKDQLDNKNIPDLELMVILIPDSDYYEVLGTYFKPMKIHLDKMRKLRNQWKNKSNAFDILQKEKTLADAGFVFGAVDFEGIITKQRVGTGHIGVSIWHNWTPVEDLSLSFCISEMGCAEGTSTASCQEKERVGISSSLPPAAALHYFGLGSKKVVGVFWNNDNPEQFLRWDMDRSPDEMKKYFLDVLIKKFNKPKPEEEWRRYGNDFFNFIFPLRSTREVFRNYVKKHIKKTPFEDENPPLLFIRFTEIKDEMPFILPIGMMAVDLGGGKTEFIGFHFKIESPLKYPNYINEVKCISRWVLSMPVKDKDLKNYYEKISADVRQSWRVNAGREFFEDLPTFENWLKEEVTDNKSAAIIVMSHHGENTFADSTGEVSSSSVRREFRQPSFVILNGCGTMEPSSTDFIKQLNKRGIIAVIATSTSVDKEMAADFLESFSQEIRGLSDKGVKDISISELFFMTQKRLYSKYDNHKGNVLRYTLLGDGNLRLCVQK
jgi:outer membrane protein OmpA-like peptidoglycan-associated protein